jgi:hypothetical protein
MWNYTENYTHTNAIMKQCHKIRIAFVFYIPHVVFRNTHCSSQETHNLIVLSEVDM